MRFDIRHSTYELEKNQRFYFDDHGKKFKNNVNHRKTVFIKITIIILKEICFENNCYF